MRKKCKKDRKNLNEKKKLFGKNILAKRRSLKLAKSKRKEKWKIRKRKFS